MNMKKVTLAALAATALLATAPAFADGNRGDRHFNRGDQFQNQFRGDRRDFRHDRYDFRGGRHDFRRDHFRNRVVYVEDRAPRYYWQGPAFVHYPVVEERPVVVYRDYRSHDVLGGLIIGTVLGAVIANHAGY